MSNHEPIAYWDGKHFASKEKSSLANIPLYTAPHYRDWETDRKSTRLNSSH